MDIMDPLHENLFRIEGKVGNIDGKVDGILRELTRLVGQLDQHLQDDRQIHAMQDERLLNTVKDLTAQLSTAIDKLDARVEALERGRAGDAAARGTSEKWRIGLATLFGAASGYLSGLFSRWPPGHH
jgi:predicted RecB family endonuclease